MKHIFFQIPILFLAFIIAGCGSSVSSDSTSDITTPDTTMTIRGLVAYATKAGKPEYILKADKALILEQENMIRMSGIDLTFFKTSGKNTTGNAKNVGEKEGKIKALKGVYYFQDSPQNHRKKDDIDLAGNVLLTKSDGTMLKTPKLHYVSATGKIYSNAGFEKRINSNGRTYISTGKSFITDRDMHQWEQTGGGWSSQSNRKNKEKTSRQ